MRQAGRRPLRWFGWLVGWLVGGVSALVLVLFVTSHVFRALGACTAHTPHTQSTLRLNTDGWSEKEGERERERERERKKKTKMKK